MHPTEHVDVIVVGAGISGIGAARYLQEKTPGSSYAILEARDNLGGTWDLFRYPGIRSDSDMFTLGYAFKPWREKKAIADGASILNYVQETAREHGIESKIRYGHRVKCASWSSERALWTLDIERGPASERTRMTCRFLYACAGYYAYEAGYTPAFEGLETFAGRVVHPQRWTPDIDYAGKRVVVIGSGATAMTLVPALAQQAAHVVMLQRSPSYVVSSPARDQLANYFRRKLPDKLAYALTRWKNILFGLLFFNLLRLAPRFFNRGLVQRVARELPGYDVARHFTPRYNVWDQRLCLVPDGDLFEAIRAGRASVVTEHIDRFTPRGIRLQNGEEVEADLVVTATGLELTFLGGIELSVDGRRVDPGQLMIYKGCMLSGVPNAAFSFGYTNASWTLKAELTSEYVCRVLRRMEQLGATHCTPRRNPTMPEQPWLDFSSGYITRSSHRLPKQGLKRPFRLYQNYALDLLVLRYGKLEDGTLEFARASDVAERSPAAKLPA